MGVGGAVEGCSEFRELVGGKHRHSGRHVVGLCADPEHEAAVDRGGSAKRNARKLHDYTIVVLRKKRHRVLDLTGKGNRGSGTTRSATGVITPVSVTVGAPRATVVGKEADPQDPVS